jgi:hypothetical protein
MGATNLCFIHHDSNILITHFSYYIQGKGRAVPVLNEAPRHENVSPALSKHQCVLNNLPLDPILSQMNPISYYYVMSVIVLSQFT